MIVLIPVWHAQIPPELWNSKIDKQEDFATIISEYLIL